MLNESVIGYVLACLVCFLLGGFVRFLFERIKKEKRVKPQRKKRAKKARQKRGEVESKVTQAFAATQRKTWRSTTSIAQAVNANPKTVNRVLNRLVDTGYLEKRKAEDGLKFSKVLNEIEVEVESGNE